MIFSTALCALLLATFSQFATAQISDDVVRIGVLTDLSGQFSALSGPGGVVAARMAIEDFGAKVLGKPVEVIAADHGNKTDVASTVARRWFDVGGVDMIVDVPNSSVALAVQAIARERKRVVIASAAGTAELTGKACSPTSFQWTWDTYSVAVSTGKAVLEQGGDSWFIIAADYTFGHTMANDLSNVVKASGGTIAGIVRHPLNPPDFSSFIVQAQASNAKVIALANGGSDTINSIKQANEFGIGRGKQKLVGLAIFISDVHAMGLKDAQGLLLTTGFYWDRTPATRQWSQRFFVRHKAMPTMAQAGVYSAVTHYLKAVAAAGTDDGEKVATKMRELPVNDFFAEDGRIREDGRMVHDMYLAQVKTPAQSRYPWDYYTILGTVPGETSVRPLKDSDCPSARR